MTLTLQPALLRAGDGIADQGVLAASGVDGETAPPRTAPQPPSRTPSRPVTEDSADEDSRLSAAYFARKQYLNNYLIRDRDYCILLGTATSALENGETFRAIEALQSIWDAPRDVLAWDDERREPESARLAADALMRQADGSIRDAYERRCGGTAKLLLDAVLVNHDVEAERELLRRYAHTRAAGELFDLKAQRAIDRGELEEAAGYWDRILCDAWLRAGLEPAHLAAVLSLCERIRSTDGRDDGKRLTFDASVASAPTHEALWGSRYFDEAVRAGAITGPASSAADHVIDDLEDVVGAWTARQRGERMPLGGAGTAVAAGDLVVVRDFSGVTAYVARTGVARWRFECETSLCAVLRAEAGDVDASSRENRRRTSRADLFADQVAEHSTLSTLTTDGERVYLIDEIHTVESSSDGGESDADGSRRRRGGTVLRNRLLALTLDGLEPGRLSWSRGGSAESSRSELTDFYFLGPPWPHHGSLYAIGEQSDELHLVVLDAETGSLAWTQPIALIDRPVAECEPRARAACMPRVSQGVVICPTQLPVLVGLDAATGTLLWVYHAAGEERPDSPTWARPGRSADPEPCSDPVIAGHRMLFVPPDSRKLHCVDIRNGRRQWWVDAPPVRFLSCADDALVLLVSADECIGLRLEDGRQEWRTPINAPAGRGVAAGDAYFLPLNGGQLVELKLSDGSIRPNLLERDEGELAGRMSNRFCGNLLIHEDLIVCSSSTGLSVFPQARPLLDRLLADHPAADAPADILRRAELHMQLSEYDDAIAALRWLLASAPPAPIRESGRRRLYELLYVDLAGDTAPKLDELARLASTPAESARCLLHRLNFELGAGLLESAAGSVGAIRELPVVAPIPMDHTGRYLVHPLEQARFALEQFAFSADLADRERLRRALRTHLNFEMENDPERLREAVVLLGQWGPEEELITQLARKLVVDGQSQSAELLLWDRRFGRGSRVRGETVDRFQSSRSEAAIRQMSYATPGRSGPPAGRHVVSYRPDHDETRPTLAGFDEPRAIPAVDIREVVGHDAGAESVEDACRPLSAILEGKSHFVRIGGKTVRLLQTGEQNLEDAVERFTVIDDGITEAESIDTPPARWKLPESPRYSAGHLVPLCGKGVLMLSLLEQRLLWHTPPATEVDGHGPLLGPFGPDFCVLQQGEELTVVNPVSGEPLWRRGGLRHQSGLEANEETGIIGDGRVLVHFDPDQAGYELFETRSGAVLRRGVLPLERPAGTRHLTSFGRRLMYRTEIDGVPRLRLWDPVDDRLLMDDPIDAKFAWHAVPDRQRAAVLRGRSLRSIDGVTGDCEWEIEVDEEHLEHVRKVLMFSDGGIDFVLLDRHVRDAQTSTTSLDVRVPSIELCGDLYAIDHGSGAPLWNGPLLANPCRALVLPHALPYLVTVTRVRDARDHEAYRLKVDVIDIETGRLVGTRADLTTMPILHTSFNPSNGQLTLWGPERRIEIGYSVLTVTRH